MLEIVVPPCLWDLEGEEKKKSELQEVKRRKLSQDKLDYEQSFVYSWNGDKLNTYLCKQRRAKDNRGDNNVSNDAMRFLDPAKQTSIYIDLLYLILTCIYFSFGENFFLQCPRSPMFFWHPSRWASSLYPTTSDKFCSGGGTLTTSSSPALSHVCSAVVEVHWRCLPRLDWHWDTTFGVPWVHESIKWHGKIYTGLVKRKVFFFWYIGFDSWLQTNHWIISKAHR